MSYLPRKILIPLAGFALCANINAVVLVNDTFSVADRALRGHTPDVVDVSLAGSAWGGSADYSITNNTVRADTGASGASSGHFETFDFGVSYFSNNPAIYELTSDIFIGSEVSSSGQFLSIGFTLGSSQSFRSNRNHYSTNTSTLYGAPSIGLRGNGEALVNTIEASTLYSSGAGVYASDATHQVRLVLDTTQANWVLDAYVDGGQLDLDEGSASMSYVFTTNPDIRYLSISSNVNVANSENFYLDNVLVQTVVPEPSTYAMIVGALIGIVAYLRRRR